MQVDSDRERHAQSLKSFSRFPDFSHPAAASDPIRPQDLAAANRAALRAQIADRIVRDLALLDRLDAGVAA